MNELIWYRARNRKFGSQWLYYQVEACVLDAATIADARRRACDICGIGALFEMVKQMPKLKPGGVVNGVEVYYEDVMQEAR